MLVPVSCKYFVGQTPMPALAQPPRSSLSMPLHKLPGAQLLVMMGSRAHGRILGVSFRPNLTEARFDLTL